MAEPKESTGISYYKGEGEPHRQSNPRHGIAVKTTELQPKRARRAIPRGSMAYDKETEHNKVPTK
jgi:hypothetical protein